MESIEAPATSETPAETPANINAPKPKHSDTWRVLTEEELERPEAILLGWLFQRAQELKHTPRDMARNLAVTHGYIRELRLGVHRHANRISHQFALACGRYLGIPTIMVKIAAGQVTPEDFMVSERADPNTYDRTLRVERSDGRWLCVLPDLVWSTALNDPGLPKLAQDLERTRMFARKFFCSPKELDERFAVTPEPARSRRDRQKT